MPPSPAGSPRAARVPSWPDRPQMIEKNGALARHGANNGEPEAMRNDKNSLTHGA